MDISERGSCALRSGAALCAVGARRVALSGTHSGESRLRTSLPWRDGGISAFSAPITCWFPIFSAAEAVCFGRNPYEEPMIYKVRGRRVTYFQGHPPITSVAQIQTHGSIAVQAAHREPPRHLNMRRSWCKLWPKYRVRSRVAVCDNRRVCACHSTNNASANARSAPGTVNNPLGTLVPAP